MNVVEMSEVDRNIFVEFKNGNFSRLLYLQGIYTQHDIAKTLLVSEDVQDIMKMSILRHMVKNIYNIEKSMNEEYKTYSRVYNNKQRDMMHYVWVDVNNPRVFDMYWWKRFNNKTVIDESHERNQEYQDKRNSRIEKILQYASITNNVQMMRDTISSIVSIITVEVLISIVDKMDSNIYGDETIKTLREIMKDID